MILLDFSLGVLAGLLISRPIHFRYHRMSKEAFTRLRATIAIYVQTVDSLTRSLVHTTQQQRQSSLEETLATTLAELEALRRNSSSTGT